MNPDFPDLGMGFSPYVQSFFLVCLQVWYLGLIIYGIAPVSFINKDINISSRKNHQEVFYHGQFTISIILIAGTIGALKQISHMQKDAFTMNIDQTLVVKRPVDREFNPAQKSFQETF